MNLEDGLQDRLNEETNGINPLEGSMAESIAKSRQNKQRIATIGVALGFFVVLGYPVLQQLMSTLNNTRQHKAIIMQTVEKYDLNGDGQLDQREFANYLVPRILARYDVNQDGKLGPSELGNHVIPPIFAEYDVNNDKTLSPTELTALIK